MMDTNAQKKAKLEEKSIYATLVADVQLINNLTNEVVDTRNKYPVFQVPHLTLHNSIHHQWAGEAGH